MHRIRLSENLRSVLALGVVASVCLACGGLGPAQACGPIAPAGRARGGVGALEPGRARSPAARRSVIAASAARGQSLEAGEGRLRDRVDQRHPGQGRRRHDDPGQRDLPDYRLGEAGQGPVPRAAHDDAVRQGPGRVEQRRVRRPRPRRRGHGRRGQLPGPARLHRGRRGRPRHRATRTAAGACLTRSSSRTRSGFCTGPPTCRIPTGGSGPTGRRTWGSTRCCSPVPLAATRRSRRSSRWSPPTTSTATRRSWAA